MVYDALSISRLLLAENGVGEKELFRTQHIELHLDLFTCRSHHLAFSEGLYFLSF